MHLPERRRYARLPWKQEGQAAFKDHLGDPVQVSVTIMSVSPEGMGLSMHPDIELPSVGKMLTLGFKIGQRDISLPGRVIWKQRGPQHTAVGIRLMLELAKASMRQAYARWIVERLEREQPSGPPGAVAR